MFEGLNKLQEVVNDAFQEPLEVGLWRSTSFSEVEMPNCEVRLKSESKFIMAFGI